MVAIYGWWCVRRGKVGELVDGEMYWMMLRVCYVIAIILCNMCVFVTSRM